MSDSAEEPDFLALRCPTCQAGLRIRSKLAGTTGTCPQCGGAISIPLRPEIDFDSAEETNPVSDPLDAEAGYRLAELVDFQPDDQPAPLPPELRPVAPEGGFLGQMARVRTERAESAPRILFYTGVFEFPWYTEVWPRWGWLVLGGSAATMIPVLAWTYLGGLGGYAGVSLAFFAMPQIWITLWTGAFAAACGMQVFEHTAAGSDHIFSWPEPNWRDWVWQLMYLGYVAAMVLAIAYGIGLAAGGSPETLLMSIAITEFFLFPFCLLSVMEANNLAILVSPGILATLFRKGLSWILFYLVTGFLTAIWLGIAWLVCQVTPLLLIPVNGLLYASLVLIWFRLLGRLAWSISHRRSKKRRTASAVEPSAI